MKVYAPSSPFDRRCLLTVAWFFAAVGILGLCIVLCASCTGAPAYPITGADGHRYRLVRPEAPGTGVPKDAALYEQEGKPSRYYLKTLGSPEEGGLYVRALD